MPSLNAKLCVLEALTHIGVNGPTNPCVGICTNVLQLTDNRPSATTSLLRGLIESWPELGENNPNYPVEDTSTHYVMNTKKWDVNTAFGAKRYRLLAFLIHKLTKEIRAEVEALPTLS